MKNVLKKFKIVMALILVLGIAFVCGFGTSNTTVNAGSTTSVNYDTEWYKLAYDEATDTISLQLSTDISSYAHIGRSDLGNAKDYLKDVLVKAIKDDIDFSSYYSSGAKPRVRTTSGLKLSTPSLAGESVDVSILGEVLATQSFTMESINDTLIGGDTYDTALKYYVDKYVESYCDQNPTTPVTSVIAQVKNQIQGYVETEVKDAYEAAGYSESTSQSINAVTIALDKIDDLVDDVATTINNGGSVDLDINDVQNVIELVNNATIISTYISNIDAKSEIKTILTNSNAADVTNFIKTVDTDLLVDVVKKSDIIDKDTLTTVIDNIGVSNLMEVIEEIDLQGLADLAKASGLSSDDVKEIVTKEMKSLSIGELLTALDAVSIDGYAIYSSGDIQMGGIKSVIANLATPSEIAAMSDDEMVFTHSVVIETKFGTIDCNLELSFFGDKSRIRKVCDIIAQHLDIYKDQNGVYTVELRIPQKAGELIAEFLNSSKGYVSDTFKAEIFDYMDYSVDELYNEFINSDIDKWVDLLEEVNYKALFTKLLSGETYSDIFGVNITDDEIDKVIDLVLKLARKLEDKTYADILDFLDGYFDTTKLQNEKIETIFNYAIALLNKVDDGTLSASKIREWLNDPTTTNDSVYTRLDKLRQYDDKFDKLKTYVTKVYNHVPDRYKTKTIVDYYTEENVFDISANINISAIIDLLPQTIQDGLDVFVNGIPSDIDVRVKVTLPHVYKVEYVIGNKTKVGFLPAGAKIAEYSGETMVNGLAIESYVDIDKNVITEVPESDITVYAYAAIVLTNSADIDKEYDGNVETLSVQAAPPEDPFKPYNYQWYKDGVAIQNATSSTYKVLNVSDSGVYTCEVTNKDGSGNGYVTAVTDEINVNITPQQIDVSGYAWTYTDALPFDFENSYILELVDLNDDRIVATYSGNKANLAGSYTSSVSFDYADGYNDGNYEIVGTVDDIDWEITPLHVDASLFTWDYTASYEYNEAIQKIELVNVPDYLVATYTDNAKKDSGNYTASAVLSIKNNAYVDSIIIDNEVASQDWVITPKTIIFDEDNCTWIDDSSFTYSGKAYKVVLTERKGDLLQYFDVTYSDNEQVNAGSYTAKATFTCKDMYKGTNGANYILDTEEISHDWTIGKASLNLSFAKWTAPTYTYDGTEKTVLVTGLPEGVTAAYENNTATVVGKYTAKVTFTFDETNFDEEPPFTKEFSWEIEKATYDMSNVKWSNTSFTYDGNEKEVALSGLPQGVTATLSGDYKATNAGAYTAKVTLSYDTANYNEVKVDDYNWSIEKANYDMSNVKWSNASFTYDGNEKEVALSGLPEGVSATLSDNKATSAGAYTAKVTLSYDTVNYNEVKVDDYNWSIEKANYDMSAAKWNYLTAFTYDKEEKTVSVVGLPEGVSATLSGDYKATNAGAYTAKVALSYDEANYNEIAIADLAWEIEKATVNFDQYAWSTKNIFNYDKQTHKVTFDVDDLVTVTFDGVTSEINAGSYTATATLSLADSANYESIGTATKAITWKINPGYIDVSAYTWTDTNSFVYDGSEKTVALTSWSAKLDVVYTNAKATNAGKYVAKASFVSKDPNLIVMGEVASFTWEIEQASIDVSGYKWTNESEFTYDGNAHQVQLASVIDNKLEAVYTNNNQKNAGVYTASVNLVSKDVNYKVVGTVQDKAYTIKKATIDVSGYKWTSGRSYEYTGKMITVKLASAVDEKLDVTYTNNSNKEVGKYAATVTFAVNAAYVNNYVVVGSVSALSWEIVENTTPVNPPVEDKTTTPTVQGDNTNVKISVEDGISKEYTAVVALSDKEVNVEAKRGQKVVVGSAYDIHFAKAGAETTPDRLVTIQIKVPENLKDYDEECLAVVHIDDDGNATYVVKAGQANVITINGEAYIEFTTANFSVFAVVAVKQAATYIYWIIAFIVIIIVAIILLIVTSKKKNNKDDDSDQSYFAKLSTVSDEQKQYYAELKSVIAKYQDQVKAEINENYEMFLVDGKTLASFEIENAEITVKTDKSVTVTDEYSLMSAKKLLKKAFERAHLTPAKEEAK